MPTQAITSDFLASLAQIRPTSGLVSYFDTELRGFLLELRASGRASWYFRYRDAQRKIRLCRIGTFPEVSLADARAKAYEMRTLLREGGDPKTERLRFSEFPTFAEFANQHYLPFAKVRKRSWQIDENLLRNHLTPRFGAKRLNRISRAEVVAMQQEVFAKGYAAATCNRLLILLKFMLNCAIRWEILPEGGNPCVGVSLLADHGARERYLSAAEVQALFAELTHNPNQQVCKIIHLLLLTGARKREILNARWECIDFERQMLTVPLSKSGRPRHIPLSDGAIALLRSVPRDEDVPWVFFNRKTGKPLVTIFNAWKTIRRRAGLEALRLHDLRHSFASFLVNSGRSLYEVQRLLGHHDPKVTMRYAHLSPSALIEAANVVSGVLSRSIPKELR